MDLGQRLLPEEIEKIESALTRFDYLKTRGIVRLTDLVEVLEIVKIRRDPKSIVAESLDQFIDQLRKYDELGSGGLLNMLAYHKKLNADSQSQDIATHLEREGVCDASSEVEQLRAERDAAINIALNERERIARYFDGSGFAAKALANGIRAIPAPVFPEARVHRAAIQSHSSAVAETDHTAGDDWGTRPSDRTDPNYGRRCGICMEPVRAGMKQEHGAGVCTPPNEVKLVCAECNKTIVFLDALVRQLQAFDARHDGAARFCEGWMCRHLDLPPVEPVEPDTMVEEVMKLTSRLDALTAELTKVQKALTRLCEKVQATSSEAEASRTLFICRACDATTTGRTDSSFDTPGWRRLDGLDGPDAICPRCVADPTALTWLRDDYPDVRLRPEPSPQPAIPVVAGWVVKNNAPDDQKPFLGRIGWSDTPTKAGPFTDRASANSEAKARTYANLTVLPVDADGAVIEERAKLPVPTPWNRWLADALRHQANVDDGSGTTGPRQEASTRFARFCRHLADKVISEGADAFDWPPTPSELEVERLTRERDAALALARRCREVALGLARSSRQKSTGSFASRGGNRDG